MIASKHILMFKINFMKVVTRDEQDTAIDRVMISDMDTGSDTHMSATSFGLGHDLGNGHDFGQGHVRKPRKRTRTRTYCGHAFPLISGRATKTFVPAFKSQ